MPTLKDFIEALQIGWFPALVALIGCSIVIMGDLFSIPYLSNAPDWIPVAAAYIGVFALCILLVNIGFCFWKKMNLRRKKKEYSIAIQHEIENAPAAEKATLAYLVTTNKKAFQASLYSNRLAPLISKNIIVQLHGQHSQLEWPHIVQEDAWEFLLKNKDQFFMPNASGMKNPFHWLNEPK